MDVSRWIVWIHFWGLFVAIDGKLILRKLQCCQKEKCTLQSRIIGQNIVLEYFTIYILPNLSRTGKKTMNSAVTLIEVAQANKLLTNSFNHGPWLMYSEMKILGNWTMYHVPSATILAVVTRFLSTMNQYFLTNFFLVESNRIDFSQCAYSQIWTLYIKVASFCFELFFFSFLYVVWFARYRASNFKMSFFV